uniref:LAM_G_DOMAIN domain-containing protein n=1 Tax=Panagrellus redivivus TaxID=6233 RepID=A0A7E4VYS0_PANRE
MFAAALTFSFDQLHDRAGVAIFSDTGNGPLSVKLEHVPEYILGEIVTVQYSGSPGIITVRSVPPSNCIVLESNGTPKYALLPRIGPYVFPYVYAYDISVLNNDNEKSWTFHLTTLSLVNDNTGVYVDVWKGDKRKFYQYSAADIQINKVLVFDGTRISIYADNVVRRLYFSVAFYEKEPEDKPGRAIGRASHTILLFATICTALWNYYKFLL